MEQHKKAIEATALVVASGLLAGLIVYGVRRKEQAPQSTTTYTTPIEFNRLVHDPARIEALSKLALSDIKKDIVSKSGVNLYIYTGTCALMRDTGASSRSGVVVADIIPDPAAVSILDTKTGVRLTETIGYNPSDHHYEIGGIFLSANSTTGPETYNVPTNNQVDINASGVDMNVVLTPVIFSENDHEVVINDPGYRNHEVMDSMRTVRGKPGESLGYVALFQKDVQATCNLAITGSAAIPKVPAT